MASRRGRRRLEYLDLAYSRAAFSAERGAADDGRRRQFGDHHLWGDGGGRATTTAAGLAVAVVAVAVAVVVAVAVAAVVVLFLGEKTVLAGGALSECKCVPNKCSVHLLTESLCIVTPLTKKLSSHLH